MITTYNLLRSGDEVDEQPDLEESPDKHGSLITRAEIAEVAPTSERTNFFGSEVLRSLHKDAIILIACKTVRMFAFGFLSVMLVVYLKELNFNSKDVGLMFTLTLLGDAVISILMTSHADKWGRRKTLILSALIAIFTSVMFASQSNFWVLLVSAIIGVISPSGNEIGPFMAIELSALSQVTCAEHRTRLMAWYNLFGCFSSAVGALVCGGLIVWLNGDLGIGILGSYRITMSVYAGVKMILCILFYRLGPDIEVPPEIPVTVATANPVSLFLGLHRSKGIVVQLSALFMLDAFGGSFVLQSIMSGWFNSKYNTSSATLGTIVFVCNIVAGVSALFAAQLADRIGLILTMVVTHVPSNILLILVPLMPTETWAIVMLCARFCISQMDSPTRNAYVQGVVHPDERSAANGVTNVVRSIGASAGPYLAGLLLADPRLMSYPWIIAGVLKVVYDVLLLYNMQGVKPDVEIEKQRRQDLLHRDRDRGILDLELSSRKIGIEIGTQTGAELEREWYMARERDRDRVGERRGGDREGGGESRGGDVFKGGAAAATTTAAAATVTRAASASATVTATATIVATTATLTSTAATSVAAGAAAVVDIKAALAAPERKEEVAALVQAPTVALEAESYILPALAVAAVEAGIGTGVGVGVGMVKGAGVEEGTGKETDAGAGAGSGSGSGSGGKGPEGEGQREGEVGVPSSGVSETDEHLVQ